MFSRQGILLFPSKEYWNRGEKNCSLYYFISRLSEGKIRALYNLTIISRSQELKCHILNLLYSVSYFYFPISKFRKKKSFFFVCLFVLSRVHKHITSISLENSSISTLKILPYEYDTGYGYSQKKDGGKIRRRCNETIFYYNVFLPPPFFEPFSETD